MKGRSNFKQAMNLVVCILLLIIIIANSSCIALMDNKTASILYINFDLFTDSRWIVVSSSIS